MTNAEIAKFLREMSIFLDMTSVPFKPRAYEKAAYAVESLERPVEELYAQGGLKALGSIPSVGRGIAERIEELLRTGRCRDHERLRRVTPVDVVGLTAIEGLGPKMVKVLYDDLGVRTVADLERAARAGRIHALPHFGEKSEQKILRGIGFLQQGGGRRPLGEVLDLAREIEGRLREIAGVEQVAIAGSIRRRKETIGDADFLVVSRRPERVMDVFVHMAEVAHVHGRGGTKSSVRLANGMDADLRVVSARSFGAALAYFTGSKDHNVALRRIAQERGWKLNEYGVFDGERAIAGETEEDVYTVLGLQWVPPEMREDTGEIELARRRRLPKLIEHGALRGDLQIQTTWTDGANSLEEMVEAGRRLGLEYMAITDHTRGLAMTGGSDEKQLLEQIAAIRRLDRGLRGFRLLAGAEVNIDRDGGLDIADEMLARLDVVGVAVHSHFHLSRAEQTRRIVRAMENPHADILFHPTGRILMKRDAYEVDIDAVIAAAKRTGTVLEIDALPERLDLKDEHVRKAVAAGVRLTIDSDAHHVNHMRYPDDFGIAVARRGWARAADVINTLPVERFLACLKDGRGAGKRRPAPRGRASKGGAKPRAGGARARRVR
jgi:DNA polymerase (family 10)